MCVYVCNGAADRPNSRLKIKSPQYVALAFLDARGDVALNEQKML
jgi:hypothetical protein